MANDHGNLVLLGGFTRPDALHRRRQLVGRPRTAFRCRQGTVSVKELPIRVHHFQVRLDLALKLCLQLVLDLLHHCERPLLQLINGEEVSNETALKRDRDDLDHWRAGLHWLTYEHERSLILVSRAC
jgi:hypothetical protein